ncbi:VOC family protein [Pendulispora albinea]|uniref:VOC family protein n=1 Tax=Pendulispora albinea TaxID=2741071 RepID=A0ABZ2LPM1_9BACT
MARPFHYAFLVRDLESTRRFYGSILGCPEGRSTETWVDFDFFGNQISAHVNDVLPAPIPCGHVDQVVVPIPHAGAVLDWDEFQALAKRLQDAQIAFLIAPMIRYAGRPEEQATMFFTDFSGNAIELKAYRHPEHVFSM